MDQEVDQNKLETKFCFELRRETKKFKYGFSDFDDFCSWFKTWLFLGICYEYSRRKILV